MKGSTFDPSSNVGEAENRPAFELIGQTIDGRYRVVRVIANGGMSTVYEATHVKIGRTVAIKVLHRDMAGDPEIVARFLNEARIVGTLGHPNIVASTDFGELGGLVPYLVLEYLEGQPLADEIAGRGALSVRRAVRVALQIASALDAAHARGVIHRDLTSGNIFLTHTDDNPDHVKVLDFGISKFLTARDASPRTRRGLTMGTPEFMAPEQIALPESVDGRADIYALGVIMYQMLVGHAPFHDAPMQDLFTQVVLEPPPPIERSDVPSEIKALIMRALAKNPADRFATMKDLASELLRCSERNLISGAYATGPTTSPGAGRPITGGLRSRYLAEISSQPAVPVPPRRGARRIAFVLVALAAVGGGVWVLARRGTLDQLVARAPVAAPIAPPMAAAPPAVAPVTEALVKLEVSSPTAEARVLFRGHAHQLPFTDTVRADNKLEVIEITAPRREGKRFWLTVDQPMHLSAELSPGRGLLEATTEETQVALGEREADPRPAAGTADGTAKRNSGGSQAAHRRGKPTPPAATNRRAAAEAPASPAPVSAPPPAPRPELAEAKAAEPPPSASVAFEASTPAAAKPAATSPIAASPKTTALVANPAAAAMLLPAGAAPAIGRSTKSSALSPAQIHAVVQAHDVDIRRCHQRAKIDNSDIKGKLLVRIALSAGGSVNAATAESSTLHSHGLEDCIVGAVQTWAFPAPSDGPGSVVYQFVLR